MVVLRMALVAMALGSLMACQSGGSASGGAERPAGDAQDASRAAAGRLLYLTHAAGFRHPVLPVTEQVVPELGRSSGLFEATVTDECCEVLSAESLRQFDAVLFFTSGELPATEAQRAALMDFVRSGKGFAGVHSATDTFYEWPEYGEMVGGYFDGHPWHEEVTIRVENRDHPATRHLGSSFRMKDEIYQFRNWSRGAVDVLLSLDADSVDLTRKGVNRTDGDFGITWTRSWGQGRVFYTALGHEADVWHDRRFQDHVVGGLRWVMGK